MPKKAKGDRFGEQRRIIPEALGNRECVGDEVLIVHYTVPTEAEKRAIRQFGDKETAIKVGDDWKIEISQASTTAKLEYACALKIFKVENYVNQNDEPILSGEDFAKYGDTPYVQEVGAAILGHLETDDIKKKSSGSQASDSQGQTASNGTAENAPDSGSTDQQPETVTDLPMPKEERST